MLRQYTIQGQFKADEEQIRVDARRLIVARYLVFFLGAAMLTWLGAKTLLLGESVSLMGAWRVIMVAVLGPALVWLVSDKEIGLLSQLERHNNRLQQRDRQLEQRNRENQALNRMAQSHLSDCLSDWPQPELAQVEPNRLTEGPAIFTEHTHYQPAPVVRYVPVAMRQPGDGGNGYEMVREDELPLVMENSRLVGARRD